MENNYIKKNVLNLSSEAMANIENVVPSWTYSAPSRLYYEEQTPWVAYFIQSGLGKLQNGMTLDLPVVPGQLIGLRELMSLEPSPYGAEVEAGSKLLFLDRSTVFEIMNEDFGMELKTLFEGFLKEA